MSTPTDLFALAGGAPSIHTPRTHAQAIDVSSADVTPTYVSCEIVAAVAGVVCVDTQGGDINVAVPLAAGIPMRLRVVKFYHAGSTATGIVALT